MATLKVKIEESISLDGQNYGSKRNLNISSIDEISKRIVTVPASEIILISMGTAVAAGTFDEAKVKYIRITNLHSSYYIELTFRGESNDEFAVKLDYGQSFIYNGDLDTGVVDTMDAKTGDIGTVGLEDLVDVTAKAVGGPCDVEVFVASA